MIVGRDLKKIYNPDSPCPCIALDGACFSIKSGEIVAIMGPSGSGKSTLMHIMGFLDRPSAGVYEFEGKEMNELSDDELAETRNKQMGFVFQSFNLLARTSVFDNVMLPLIYGDVKKEKAKKMVEIAVDKVRLSHRVNHYPNQLSGGEQQRVAIARALINNPSVIFADEPTGNLDSKSGKIIMDLLQELNDKGHTIILVTHEDYTAKSAKRIIRLEDGKIVSDKSI